MIDRPEWCPRDIWNDAEIAFLKLTSECNDITDLCEKPICEMIALLVVEERSRWVTKTIDGRANHALLYGDEKASGVRGIV